MPEVISFRLYASSMLDAPLGRTNPAQPLQGFDRVGHKYLVQIIMRIEPSFLFDLDGTLVDSVYQHVLA
jgi:hypothetical protein